MHVVIAGGGPVGLASALGLCRQGVKCTVVERETRERVVATTNGSGMVMYSCSNYILKRLGLAEKFTSISREWDILEMQDAKDKKITQYESYKTMRRKTPLGEVQGTTPVGRFVLARVFLAELEKYAEEGLFEIHFETQISEYQKIGKDRVALVAEKNGESVRIEGDFLFACDGVHSLIRKQMMNELKVKGDYVVDSGVTTYWGKYEESEDKSNTKELPMETFIPKDKDTARFYARIGGPSDPAYFMWGWGPADTAARKTGVVWAYLVRTSPKKKNEFDVFAEESKDVDLALRAARTGEEVKQELLDRVSESSNVAKLVKQTDPERVLKTNLLYHKRMDAPYTCGRVVLLGDACHPESPTGGQGLNMGLVDAYILSLYLPAALKNDSANAVSVLRNYDSFTTRAAITSMVKRSFFNTNLLVSKSGVISKVAKVALKLLTGKMFFRYMLIGAEDLNFKRVYKAEKYASASGLSLGTGVEV